MASRTRTEKMICTVDSVIRISQEMVPYIRFELLFDERK